jgi:hypothetical protein
VRQIQSWLRLIGYLLARVSPQSRPAAQLFRYVYKKGFLVRIYTKSAPFKYTTTFNLHCPYCSRDYTAEQTHKETIKVSSSSGVPTNQALFAQADAEFRRQQRNLVDAIEKGRFADVPKTCKCPDCGFTPSYMVNRNLYRLTIILLAFFGLSSTIPLFAYMISEKKFLAPVIGMAGCLIPLSALLWLMYISLNPNRGLIRKGREDGRNINPPEKPEITFNPTEPAQE